MYCLFSAFIPHLYVRWMLQIIMYRVVIFTDFQLQDKMDFRMKEGTLDRWFLAAADSTILCRHCWSNLHLLSQRVVLTDNVYNQPI